MSLAQEEASDHSRWISTAVPRNKRKLQTTLLVRHTSAADSIASQNPNGLALGNLLSKPPSTIDMAMSISQARPMCESASAGSARLDKLICGQCNELYPQG